MGRMDDTEDDARYPLNPYRPNQNSRSAFPSSNRSKITIRGAMVSPQIDRRYSKEDVEDDSDTEKEELNRGDQAIDDEVEDDEEDYGGAASNRRSRDDESSPDSRGKRRKLDKFALGFEFAPRAVATPPIASAAVTSSKPPARNNPADWTEDSTFVLLDAWGVLYTKNGRKSLRSDEWMDVAKKVNETSRTTRTDGQCRNRIDTLKKKYKKEKSRMDESLSTNSYWVYFKKMEELMGLPTPPPVPKQQLRLLYGVNSGDNACTNSRHYPTRLNGLADVRGSPEGSELGDDEEDDESDGLPPQSTKKSRSGPDSVSFRMLAESIKKFSEIYEKIESSKRQHMAELDKMRREFQRDLEIQKRQILQRAQEEFEKLRQEEGDEDGDGGEEDEEVEYGDEDNNDNDDINGSAENASS